jgi:hypothetical protein
MLICLFQFSVIHAAERININKKNQVVEAENRVWMATPNGLIQYNSTEDSYKRILVPVRSGSQAVREIEYNDEWLWCIMDSSLAALHIRLNEWLIFDKTNGLPSSEVNGIDFSSDFIYISTANGTARYDLLIEEWEKLENSELTGKEVKDVIVIDDKVWFFTKRGVFEYSPAYEKWRQFEIGEDTSLKVTQAYYFNKNIWLVCNQGLVQFNPTLQTFQFHNQPFLKPETACEIFTEDDNNWVISKQGLFSFGYESEVWSGFEGNSYLADKDILSGFIDDSEIWIFTEKDVRVYDRTDKNWEVIDYASGLTTTEFQDGYINGGMSFLIANNAIEYRLTSDSKWNQYEIKQLGDEGEFNAKKILTNLLDNETGGYIPIGTRKLSLEGSTITYINNTESTYNTDGTTTDKISGYRMDVKSQFGLSENRTISGFYNNIDYSETMYGIRYRSKGNDILHEINWGDYRFEQGEVPFGENASMFGTNVWLQAGKKTDKYKRSLANVKGFTGQKRSKKNYQYILGALEKFDMELEDVDYIDNQFYKIPNADNMQVVENIEIYVDDLISTNNTPNIENKTIAGLSGDFKLLKATSDYYYYEKANVIRFTGYYSSSANIVMRYTLNNYSYEEILQQDSTISTSLSNFYSFQATTIIPNSFKLSITDKDDFAVDIADFGLDDNGDGFVDQEWIDYENGILFFPDEFPFPFEVYNGNTPVSNYNINASFETKYSLVQLEYDNLVRGTEEVKIDGVIAEGGTDYVLDYTNGTLVFVKDGLVTPETRIEIEYEYYLSDDYSQMHAAAVNFSPSDKVSVQADWMNFVNDNDSTTNIVKLHSELRQKVGSFDVKIVPGAVYQAEENKITAYQVEGVISSSKVRFLSKYQNYNEDYKNLYIPQSIVGKVKEKLELSTVVDAQKNIRLSGTLNNINSFSSDNSTKEIYDKNKSARALFHHQLLPGYEITYTTIQTQTDSISFSKSYLQHKLEYQLPQQIINKLPIKGLKLEGFLKNGEQKGEEIAGTDAQKFQQSNFRINMSLAEQFQTSLFYRKNDFIDNSDGLTQNNHILTSERVLFNLSHEKWKLLQTNVRIENNMNSYDYPNDNEYNLSLSQYAQLNFRFSPGQIWSKLSPLFFEYNLNQSLYASGNSSGGKGDYLWSIIPKEKDELTNYQYLRTYYLKNEFRPNANIYFYTLYEWNNQTTTYNLSQLNSDYWLLSEKLDAKLGYKTRLRLQYKKYYKNSGYDDVLTYYEPSVWLERRWTNSFHNVFYAAYRHTNDFDNNIKDYTDKYEARVDIIVRKKDYLKMRRVEFQQSFSGGQSNTFGYNDNNFFNYGSSSSLNLYPVHALIVRVEFEADKTVYIDDSESNYLTTSLQIRASFKF